MIKKAIVLCGGLATRLLPITKVIPKEIMPILNRPALDLILKDLKNNGITDVLVILGRDKEVLENYFDKNIEIEQRLLSQNKTTLAKTLNDSFEGMNIFFKRQINPGGTAPAIMHGKSFVQNESFILIFPDELLFGKSQTAQLLESYKKTQKTTIPIKKIPIKECYRYGMVAVEKQKDGELKLTKIVEKPKTPELSPSDLCNLGGGIFTKDIFKYLEKCKDTNGEMLYTDAIEMMIENEGVNAKIIEGDREDIGNPLGFVKANITAALHSPEFKDEMEAFIAQLAQKIQNKDNQNE